MLISDLSTKRHAKLNPFSQATVLQIAVGHIPHFVDFVVHVVKRCGSDYHPVTDEFWIDPVVKTNLPLGSACVRDSHSA